MFQVGQRFWRMPVWQTCSKVEIGKPRTWKGTRGLRNKDMNLCAATEIWVITARGRLDLWKDEDLPGFLARPHGASCKDSVVTERWSQGML